MIQDLKQAARMLLHTKGWTAVVLISLALGIGANTALFTAVNGLLLQSLPVADPATLVRLKWSGENDMVRSSSEYGYSQPHGGRNVRATFSYAVFEQLRKSNRTLTDMFACAPIGTFNVIVNGAAELAPAHGVTGNYFSLLQVRPFLGRTIVEDDDKAGAAPVGVISHAYWRRRFASDPNVIGKVVTMNNNAVTIVGVTPPEYIGVQRLGTVAPDVTVPLVHDTLFNVQARLSQPTTWWVQIMGRLKPGATLEQVKGNLEGVFHQAAREGMHSYMNSLTPEQKALSTNRRDRTEVPELLASSGSRGVYDFDRTSARSASVLAVVVALVLLIVCANVANLLLSRATSRRKEISVRLSMGATRFRLVRQLLTESLLLSSLGGALGILVGYWSRQLLPFGQSTPVDWRVFAFATALSALTGIAFGFLPAFRATRVDLAGSLKESSRSLTASRTWLSKGLLVVQVAVSLVLLIGAGLFMRTLQNLRSVDVGFNSQNILMFNLNPQLNRYEPERIENLYRQIQERLQALPGVQSVSLTRTVLLSGNTSTSSIHIQNKPGEGNNVHMMTVSPEFFETMQIPLLAGRGFDDRDSKTSPKVAVINDAAARKFFSGDTPLGRRVGFSAEQSGEYEIVGVIRNTKYSSVRDEAPPTLYQSHLQIPARGMVVLLRTAVNPSGLTEPVRAAVRQVDPSLPVTNVTTQADQVENRFSQERLFARAYSLFGGLATTVACIGLFGLMSYSVARRTSEIGIRMALGASRLNVVRMVLGESLLLVVIGVAIGLGAAFALGRLVSSVLFGLAATDGGTVAAAAALMIAVSTLACYLPARRASRVDPTVALHYE